MFGDYSATIDYAHNDSTNSGALEIAVRARAMEKQQALNIPLVQKTKKGNWISHLLISVGLM